MSGVLTAGQYATASLAILALAGVLFRFFVLMPLKQFIKDQTYPIQPNANGGKSLPDIAETVARIDKRVEGIERRVMRLETRQENQYP